MRPLPRRAFGMGGKTVQRCLRRSWVFVVSVILSFFTMDSLGACTFCQNVGLQHGKLPVELRVITGGGGGPIAIGPHRALVFHWKQLRGCKFGSSLDRSVSRRPPIQCSDARRSLRRNLWDENQLLSEHVSSHRKGRLSPPLGSPSLYAQTTGVW